MSIYRRIAELAESGEEAVVCTIITSRGSVPRHAGSKMLVYRDGRIEGSVGGGEVESRVVSEALQALDEGVPRLIDYKMVDPERGDPGICGGQLEVFLEPVQAKPRVIVIGAGHVGRAVVHLAHWMGFRTALSDDREEFCNPQAAPGADQYFPVAMSELPQHIPIHTNTILILTTRGSGVDVEGLPALLDTKARYIGIIGSKRRWIFTQKGLLSAGISQEQINRIHSPIGLEISAETPEEIAVAIMAEVLQVTRQAKK